LNINIDGKAMDNAIRRGSKIRINPLSTPAVTWTVTKPMPQIHGISGYLAVRQFRNVKIHDAHCFQLRRPVFTFPVLSGVGVFISGLWTYGPGHH